jgi:prepilin-type N-terminal cleavage/methylation domain-containing protein
MKNIFKNNLGMTLMELMVSAGIIAIMSTLYIANYRTYDSSGELARVAHELVNDIRLMQNYALGLKKYDPGTGVPEMPTGWGIRMGNRPDDEEYREYRLYADRDGYLKYRHSQDDGASIELYRLVKFPPNIRVQEFDVDGENDRYFYFIFSPPDPQIYIKRAGNDGIKFLSEPTVYDQAVITLLNESSGQTINIAVNRFGLIDIN